MNDKKPKKIQDNYYELLTINDDPFFVIGSDEDFSKGFIQIYSAIFYSIKEANEKFERTKIALRGYDSKGIKL